MTTEIKRAKRALMGQTTIEWATYSWNPWEGCTKVSPGCAHCYAEARNQRFSGGANWGKGAPRRRTKQWDVPLRWNREANTGSPDWPALCRPRVFPSLCDWLDEEVPIEWLADFLKLIHDTPHLDWLLLTKRPENWRDRLLAVEVLWAKFPGSATRENFNFVDDWLKARPPHNIWAGVSVEDQARAEERIPRLLAIPAAVRWLSVEPLLGPVDLRLQIADCRLPGKSEIRNPKSEIDWVVVGGESGPKARPCNVDWVRSVLQQCQAAGVPCFVKQLGSRPDYGTAYDKPGGYQWPIHHPKGGEPSEWPEELRVRQFPH